MIIDISICELCHSLTLYQCELLDSDGNPGFGWQPNYFPSLMWTESSFTHKPSFYFFPFQTFSSGSSCGLLDIVDSLLSSNVQSTHSSTVNLLCAALEFIHALWHSKSDTAMSVLRKRWSFSYIHCLNRFHATVLQFGCYLFHLLECFKVYSR